MRITASATLCQPSKAGTLLDEHVLLVSCLLSFGRRCMDKERSMGWAASNLRLRTTKMIGPFLGTFQKTMVDNLSNAGSGKSGSRASSPSSAMFI